MPFGKRTDRLIAWQHDDVLRSVALAPPLLLRIILDGYAYGDRLHVLAMGLTLGYGWAFLFSRLHDRPIGPGLVPFAMLFAMLLPGPVPPGAATISISFGLVFGRELFGGRPILPPVLLGLTFAIFSFPEAGFEAVEILSSRGDPLFALLCLPGIALLIRSGGLAWRVAAGAVIGTTLAAALAGVPIWWSQLYVGTYAAAVPFLAGAPEAAPCNEAARWVHGLAVGALVVLFRLAHPEQPDGVLFAALLGALFAPLLDRLMSWRPGHARQ